jgi:parvulin-like peptidyl-prolyl isomerase
MKCLVIIILILLFSCEPEELQIPAHKIVAKVSSDILSTDQIDYILADYNSDISHNDTKTKYVRNWINTSILYQQALKSGYHLSKSDEFRIKQLEKELVVHQFLESRVKDIEVLDNDILSYYQTHKEQFKRQANEIRIAHFFLDSKELAITEDLKTNKNVLSSIKKFHLEKSKNGIVINGDLGYKKLSEINPLFIKNITVPKRRRRTSYKDGDVVGPLRLSGRYHFLQVLDRKKAGTYYTLEQVKDVVKERLFLIKKDQQNSTIYEKNKSGYIILNNLKKGL